MDDLLQRFVKDVGGPTNAAVILCVSGAAIHKWSREGPSATAIRRMTAWLQYPNELAQFILRNVWAKGEVWHPSQADYDAWLETEMTNLWHRSGHAAWVSDLWKELTL